MTTPRPVGQFLSEFGEGETRPPEAVPAPGAASPPIAANSDDEARARAFAEGKEEGLQLAAARHALERRKWELEEDARVGGKLAEAEERVVARLVESLTEQTEELKRYLEDELAACIRPILARKVEDRVTDELVESLQLVAGLAAWELRAPRSLAEPFLAKLPPELRSRASVEIVPCAEITVLVDQTALGTRLADLARRLDELS